MDKLLAIDSSQAACSVAIQHGEEVVEEFVLAPQDHIRRLLPMVDRLLTDNNLSLADLDGIAFSAGPGSFTGLRICLGVVQGLAFGANIPVIPISSMLVCAQTTLRLKTVQSHSLIIPCFDARMGEVYWSAFKTSDDNRLDRCIEDQVTPLDDVLAFIREKVAGDQGLQVSCVGDGWSLLDDEKQAQIFAIGAPIEVNIDTDVYPHARDILPLADTYLLTQEPLSALDAEPRYVRNEITWKKRKKIRQK